MKTACERKVYFSLDRFGHHQTKDVALVRIMYNKIRQDIYNIRPFTYGRIT